MAFHCRCGINEDECDYPKCQYGDKQPMSKNKCGDAYGQVTDDYRQSSLEFFPPGHDYNKGREYLPHVLLHRPSLEEEIEILEKEVVDHLIKLKLLKSQRK